MPKLKLKGTTPPFTWPIKAPQSGTRERVLINRSEIGGGPLTGHERKRRRTFRAYLSGQFGWKCGDRRCLLSSRSWSLGAPIQIPSSSKLLCVLSRNSVPCTHGFNCCACGVWSGEYSVLDCWAWARDDR